MTDRVNSLIVVLAEDERIDDIQPLIMAIKQLRGVLDVAPKVVNAESYCAEQRVRHQLVEKLWSALR